MDTLDPTPDRTRQSPEQRLLEAGRRLFCREGIHATGIARVLAEAGVSRKTLYERFGSKENLILAVLEHEGALWRAWFEAGVRDLEGSARERLLGVFDLLGAWFADPDFFGCAFINAVAEHDKSEAPLAGVAERHRDLTNRALLPLIEGAGVEDAAELMHQLGLVIDGAIVTAMVTRDPGAAARARAIAASLLDAHGVRSPGKVAAGGSTHPPRRPSGDEPSPPSGPGASAG